MILLALLFVWALSGATTEQVIVWEDRDFTCVAIASDQKEATDVIVRVIYTRVVIGISQDKPQPLWLNKVMAIPVYYGVTSMGDCAPVPLKEVQKIEVRWLKEVKP